MSSGERNERNIALYNQCKEAYRVALNVPVLLCAQPNISNIMNIVTKSQQDQQQTRPKSPFTDDVESLRRFATATKTSLWLKAEARRLGFVITQAGRQRRLADRVGFGLRSKVKAAIGPHLAAKFERTLFKFGLRKDGLLHPGESSINLRVLQSVLATCFT